MYKTQRERGLTLPEDGVERLHRFVYRGSDASPLYHYFTRPLVTWLVNFVPVWLAPNVITILAFLGTVLTHVIIADFMPALAPPCVMSQLQSGPVPPGCPALSSEQLGQLTGMIAPSEVELQNKIVRVLPLPVDGLDTGVPSFIFALTALSLVWYQILDAIDGQQARRLGISSTLGMLFDHGLDAFNCMIATLSGASALATGTQPWKLWILNCSTCITFFCACLESFYCGGLFLPAFNGPDEGIATSIFLFMLTSIMGGASFWLRIMMLDTKAFTPASLQPFSAQFLDAMGFSVRESGTGILTFHLNTIPILFILTVIVMTLIGNIRKSLSASREEALSHPNPKTDGSEPIFPTTLLELLATLQLPILVIILTTLWFAVPWWSTPDGKPLSLLAVYPRMGVWIMGFTLTRMTLRLLLAHQLHEQFYLMSSEIVQIAVLTFYAIFLSEPTASFPSDPLGWVDLGVYIALFTIGIAAIDNTVALMYSMGNKLEIPFFTVPLEAQKKFLESKHKRD